MHHERDGLHLNGRRGLKASCSDVLNDPGIQLVLLLKLLERAERVWDVSAMHVNPVLMPDLIELRRSDQTRLLTRKSEHTEKQ